MNVISYSLLIVIIQLTEQIHKSTSTSSFEENSPILATKNILAIENQKQPSSTGECLNSSLDIECTRYNDQIKDLDDDYQLRVRVNVTDRLHDKLKYKYTITSRESVHQQNDKPEATLRQVLFLHRHGDRTPISFPPKDPLEKEPFWLFHGYGQLTNRGKARLFLLGKLMRARYDDFLGKSVNKNQRISRASGALRCIESAQVFLSGFIELNQPNSTDADKLIWDRKSKGQLGTLWQPASIQSVPAKFDGMLAESADCKKLMDEYMNVIDGTTEVKRIMVEYKHEGEVLNSILGFEMDHFYKWFWASGQIEVERSYFPDKMHPGILAIYDRAQEAGNLAIEAYQMTLNSKRLRSGLLINDMVQNMMKFRELTQLTTDQQSADLKKFVHYAAHDLTLVVLIGMLDSWRKFPFRPDYASNIALELHQDNIKNEWFVRIFYMPEVPSKPFELHLADCERDHPSGRCLLDRFSELMKPFMIDSWQSWMKECGNDLTDVDPYIPGE